MALDAFVFCDCYEKGRLRKPPPAGGILCIEPDGSLGREQNAGTLESDLTWDEWREHACEHVGGILLRHHLGNISLIGLLRSELQREAESFPILIARVVYSGSHAGDFVGIEDIPALQGELERLRDFRSGSSEADRFMSEFRTQISELAKTALSVGKPIVF